MRVAFTAEGMHLPDIDLWLDSIENRSACWLSHAHGDHARGPHTLAIGTPETLRFHAQRLGAEIAAHPLAYGQSMDHNGARLTSLPAGHILGAAQLLVEQGGERLLYTGDL